MFQVDGQRNRTGSSPGPLVGLNVFNQLFVGGYNEYTPELLPLGSRFRHGFQGKTATALLERSVAICGLEFLPGSLSFCKQRGRCVMKRELQAQTVYEAGTKL